MIFICMITKNNCHINGFSLCLAFKQGLGAPRKWPVVFFGGHFEFFGQLVLGRVEPRKNRGLGMNLEQSGKSRKIRLLAEYYKVL